MKVSAVIEHHKSVDDDDDDNCSHITMSTIFRATEKSREETETRENTDEACKSKQSNEHIYS